MPRIRYVTEQEATPELRERMAREIAERGKLQPSTGIYGHSPTIQQGTQALNAGIGAAGRISPQLRALMNVRVASIVGCPFWIDSNSAGSSRAGASDDKIAAVRSFRTSDLFTPEEKVALELAEAMTSTPPNVTDELFTRLQQVYDEAQLVELAAIVAQENFRARFNTTFRVESQGSYCVLPQGGWAEDTYDGAEGPSDGLGVRSRSGRESGSRLWNMAGQNALQFWTQNDLADHFESSKVVASAGVAALDVGNCPPGRSSLGAG